MPADDAAVERFKAYVADLPPEQQAKVNALVRRILERDVTREQQAKFRDEYRTNYCIAVSRPLKVLVDPALRRRLREDEIAAHRANAALKRSLSLRALPRWTVYSSKGYRKTMRIMQALLLRRSAKVRALATTIALLEVLVGPYFGLLYFGLLLPPQYAELSRAGLARTQALLRKYVYPVEDGHKTTSDIAREALRDCWGGDMFAFDSAGFKRKQLFCKEKRNAFGFGADANRNLAADGFERRLGKRRRVQAQVQPCQDGRCLACAWPRSRELWCR